MPRFSLVMRYSQRGMLSKRYLTSSQRGYLFGSRIKLRGKCQKRAFFSGVEGYLINRYPVLACIGYVIAREKYPENTAKSFGIALANQYAAWKNTFGYSFRNNHKPDEKTKFEMEKNIEDFEIVNFCGETFVLNKKTGIVEGAYYRKIWQKAEPEMFDWKVIQVFNRIKPDGFNFLCQEIKKSLRGEEKHYLEAPFGKSFFAYWKSVRDYFRTKEFWNN